MEHDMTVNTPRGFVRVLDVPSDVSFETVARKITNAQAHREPMTFHMIPWPMLAEWEEDHRGLDGLSRLVKGVLYVWAIFLLIVVTAVASAAGGYYVAATNIDTHTMSKGKHQ